MENLATLADLPKEYVSALEQKNLVPLWPSLRDVMPPEAPRPRTQATCWHFRDIRPLLLQAGALTPIEKAERRVLVLANPGHGLANMRASSVIYLGMQLLLPGEWAASHRHTPNAVRLIVEGEGAYTTVEGEKCPMAHGDLILTPSGMWHEHGHDGDQEVIWLDVLDLPLVYYAEATYVQGSEGQETRKITSESMYGGGIVPSKHFARGRSETPIMRYQWTDAKAALQRIAAEEPDRDMIQVAYVNPENGEDCQKIIGYSAIMLRPNECVRLPRRSTAMVFHVIEGELAVDIDDQIFAMKRADTSCAPCFAHVTLTNQRADNSFVFVADEMPFQKKLGLYSERARQD